MRPPRFNPFRGQRNDGFFGPRHHRGQRGTDLYVLFLMAQLFQQIAAIDRKPPVTLALIAAQVAIHLRNLLPDELLRFIPSIANGCLNPHLIWKRGQWSRLIWAGFLHADDHHLYYNMASLLWKGVKLEADLGSGAFAALVVELLLVSHTLFVAACYCLASYFPDYRRLPLDLSAVGFSAVLFGFKVVLNHSTQGWSNIMGIPVPVKYICWAELVFASVINPQASFMGHLAGIAAGFIHIKMEGWGLRRRRFHSGGRLGGDEARPESAPDPPPVRRSQAGPPSARRGLALGGEAAPTGVPTGPSDLAIPPRLPAPVQGPMGPTGVGGRQREAGHEHGGAASGNLPVGGPGDEPSPASLPPSAAELRELRLRRFGGGGTR